MPKIGILLTNLGTPEAPTPKALRRYLREFLSDQRVVELPRWFWLPILYGLVLPSRPFQSARKYQQIWTTEGSPLLTMTQKQAHALEKKLETNMPVSVVAAMRYGSPSIKAGLEALKNANVQKILIFPLYPQYALATSASALDAVADALKTLHWTPEIQSIPHYYNHPRYISALVNSLKTRWNKHGPTSQLLFSFHGISQSTKHADTYAKHCHKTAALVAQALNLPAHQWQVVFQSRFGFAKWLQPYCVNTLEKLANEGHAAVDVICPGFAADCLETLEEIAITNQQRFINAGGKKLNYIPALNDSLPHIEALAEITKEKLLPVF